MKEGDLCPRCGWGHLHFEGRRDVHRSQSNEPFNPLDEMTGLVCNNCGYKQKEEHRTLDNENVPVSPGMMSATPTKGKTKTKKKTKKKKKK
jgi:hypothetical protein